MIDGRHYSITIQYRPTEDGLLYVGTVKEFPDVATYSLYASDAYWLVVDAIEGLVRLAQKMDHKWPAPGTVSTGRAPND